SADCLTLDVEGNQQSFLKDRLDGCPIGEVEFGMGAYHRDVLVEDRAARAEVARCSSVYVRSPLPGDSAPVKIALLVALLQQAEPGGVRMAQGKGGIRELLQNSVGGGPPSPVLRRLGPGSRQRNREDAKAVEPIQPWIAWNVSEVRDALRCSAC